LGCKIKAFLQPIQVFKLLSTNILKKNINFSNAYFFEEERLDTSDWQNDSTRLNSNALQKSITSKPFTSSSHSIMIIALITNRNSPSVTIVTGSVNNTSKGLMKILSKPSTKATIIAVKKLSTLIPGIK
jgi:hypothetical protein